MLLPMISGPQLRRSASRLGLAATTALFLVCPAGTAAQSVSESSIGGVQTGTRSLSESSRPVGAGSLTVGEGSADSMHSGPVRGRRRLGMRSGPVSEITVGSVRSGRTMARGETIGESSAGAVKKDLAEGIRAPTEESLTDLEDLQRRLRQLQPGVAPAAPQADEAAEQMRQQPQLAAPAPPPEEENAEAEPEDAVPAEDPLNDAAPDEAVAADQVSPPAVTAGQPDTAGAAPERETPAE